MDNGSWGFSYPELHLKSLPSMAPGLGLGPAALQTNVPLD